MATRYPTIEGELEDELEFEWEGEEEDEVLAQEFEDEFELEDEYEGEYEGEYEDEMEERWIWENQNVYEAEAEDEYHLLEGDEEFEDFSAGAGLGRGYGKGGHGYGKGKAEYGLPEFEDEAVVLEEYDDFVDPSQRAARLSVAHEAELLANLATRAASAESEAEAEAFLGALIGPALRIGARLAPKALPLIRRVAPQLVRSVAKIGGQLWRHPQTRKLVKALPSVAVRTVGDLAQQLGSGQDITARRALGTLSRNLAGVLAGGGRTARRPSRAQLAHAVRQVRQGGRVPPAARRAIIATHRLDHRFRTGHPGRRRMVHHGRRRGGGRRHHGHR